MYYNARCPLIYFYIFSDLLIRRARNRLKTGLIPIKNLTLTTIFNVDHRTRTFTIEEATAGCRERYHRHTRGLQYAMVSPIPSTKSFSNQPLSGRNRCMQPHNARAIPSTFSKPSTSSPAPHHHLCPIQTPCLSNAAGNGKPRRLSLVDAAALAHHMRISPACPRLSRPPQTRAPPAHSAFMTKNREYRVLRTSPTPPRCMACTQWAPPP
jgi:hypothetical protein